MAGRGKKPPYAWMRQISATFSERLYRFFMIFLLSGVF